MATSIMLHARLLAGSPRLADVHACLCDHYAGQRFVSVAPLGEPGPVLYANELAGTNELRIVVSGNDERVTVTALFDNLGKGASGAAVQNINIVLGLDEATGLE
jgi:N-acetyl-gamma-glutamyl-phosphate reductase